MAPRVRVFCPCRENNEEENQLPKTLWKDYALHGLEWLYYCDSCQEVKCPTCVEDEVLCRYCPSCLFEVTGASAKTDNNQCMRSCFQCPECDSSMIVGNFKTEDQTTKFTITCSYCDYKSPVDFDKTTSLARQLTALLNKDENKRYLELKQYYHSQSVKELTRGNANPLTFNQVLETKTPSNSTPEPIVANFENPDKVKYPKLRKLRSKKSKKCRACRNTLIKPEPKPTSTKFKTKVLAIDYLPAFRITSHYVDYPDQLTPGHTYTFRMTVTNPIQRPTKINLATATGTKDHRITIITPTLELGPAPEMWDEVSLIKSVPSTFITRDTKASQRVSVEGHRETGTGGLFEKGPNWATVLVEVIPSPSETEEQVQVGVLSNFNYKSEHDTGEEQDEVNCSFWTIIDFGPLSVVEH